MKFSIHVHRFDNGPRRVGFRFHTSNLEPQILLFHPAPHNFYTLTLQVQANTYTFGVCGWCYRTSVLVLIYRFQLGSCTTSPKIREIVTKYMIHSVKDSVCYGTKNISFLRILFTVHLYMVQQILNLLLIILYKIYNVGIVAYLWGLVLTELIRSSICLLCCCLFASSTEPPESNSRTR